MPETKAADPKSRRAGRVIKFRVSDAERAEAQRRAASQGLTVSAHFRAAGLGSPPPRTRQPRVDNVAVARILAELQRIRTDLAPIGNNLNQLTRYAHMDRIHGRQP